MRLFRSAAATATLLLVIVGGPWILLHTIGNPAAAWPDLAAGDVNDQVVYSLLAAVAWIAWAQFTVAFGIELVSGLRRSPVPRPLPGVFAFQQLSARALITAALMLTPAVLTILAPTAVAVAAVADRAPATPSASASTVSALRPAAPVSVSTARTETVTISASGPRTWWDLAQQHLGAGQKWAQLWTLNQGRPQPAGVRMSTPGPLKPGWTVLIPATTTAAPTMSTNSEPSSQSPVAPNGGTVVTVRTGESLSAIAARRGLDWPSLWQANQGRAQPGGVVLSDPDYLESGWTVLIPAQAALTPGEVAVHAGDTLSGIAASKDVALQQLWIANQNRAEPGGAQFTDPNYLEPGWTVRIPAPGAAAAPTASPAEKHPAESSPRPQANIADQKAASARAAAVKQAAERKATADRAAQQAAAEQRAAEQAEAKAQAVAAAAATKEAGEQRDADVRTSTATHTTPAATPTKAVAPATTLSPRATSTPEHHQMASSVMPVLITGGGGLILAGLVVAALKFARRRQFRWRRPGRSVPPTPLELLPMERALLGHGRQSAPDVAWLDHAMRSLAATLAADRAAGIPPVVAARLAADELELVMAKPVLDAPQPWTVDDSGLRWTVARTADLPLTDAARERILAPFPALACVGHTTSGQHWLLDLEMIGTLAIRGDHTRGINLARYLAAELAHNTWSDSLQVTLLGFGHEMAAANPDRLTYTDTPDDAQQITRIKTEAVREVFTQSSTDVDHGRLHNIAGDTWATHVLLIGTDRRSTNKGAAEPWAELLDGPSRQALAVVLIDPDDDTQPTTGWTITIDDTGTLQIPALDLELTAEQLPASEAAALAQLLALATRTDDEHPTHAQGDQPWDEFADTAGAMATDPDSMSEDGPPPQLSDAADGRAGSVLPLPTHTYLAAAAITEPDINVLAPKISEQTRSKMEQADPALDDDLADWRNPDSRTPKVTVLGSVDVRAQGALDPQRPRRAWNVEVVTYLATRPRGATAERLGSDLWPDEPDAHEKSKLRNAMSTARRWLGRNPTTGHDYLPVNPGTPGSVYRVEGVLVDAELFRRLRIRATARGADGIEDLDAALALVTGPPFDALRPGGYGWLADQALDHAYTAMIADVSHLVATHHLTAGNPEKAMAAAQVALLAGSYADEPLLDCAAACHAQGLSAERASYIKRILTNHDAEVEEELPPRTYEVLRRRGWLAS